MTPTPTPIDRRTLLRAAGTAAIGASLAGCSQPGRSSDAEDSLVLDPPENHDRIANADLPHPIYGEAIPEATVPAPLHDRTVTTTEFTGKRHLMLTFIYTSCTTVCPGLTAALRRVQADAIEEGYADEIAFLPITFDPEHDTDEVLETYGEDHGVDFDAGNWYFLRPETPEDAEAVVEDTFGVAFAPSNEGDGDGMNGSDGMDDGDGHARHFVHTSLILIVNKDGLVERSYTGGSPGGNEIVENARTVVEGW
ncbi:SCO family protein [Natrinema longum]|uniref:SCO family protein n=1 Tax=Natrinema longum TaxID=370324 RepID=A0A8A2UAX1_9EURY|nr:SCO family protein [Natrinema longum]MBZ6496765.1 SCO family protein [Natrinema longum]QSW85345.1 SCO family protein [Natrinema longum]